MQVATKHKANSKRVGFIKILSFLFVPLMLVFSLFPMLKNIKKKSIIASAAEDVLSLNSDDAILRMSQSTGNEEWPYLMFLGFAVPEDIANGGFINGFIWSRTEDSSSGIGLMLPTGYPFDSSTPNIFDLLYFSSYIENFSLDYWYSAYCFIDTLMSDTPTLIFVVQIPKGFYFSESSDHYSFLCMLKSYEGGDGGYQEGYDAGHKDGYDEGYDEGELAGSEVGYGRGHDAGYSEGKEAGQKAGYVEGEAAGREQGYTDGYNTGKQEGHDEGYAEGKIAGHDEGYAEGKTAGHEEGYTEGEAAGREHGYTNGYTTGKQEGYDEGKSVGHDEGYTEGKTDGHREGYLEGVQNVVDSYKVYQDPLELTVDGQAFNFVLTTNNFPSDYTDNYLTDFKRKYNISSSRFGPAFYWNLPSSLSFDSIDMTISYVLTTSEGSRLFDVPVHIDFSNLSSELLPVGDIGTFLWVGLEYGSSSYGRLRFQVNDRPLAGSLWSGTTANPYVCVHDIKLNVYTVGYTESNVNDSYHKGFNEGTTETLNSKKTLGSLIYSIVDAPFNVLANAFDFEFLGVNIGSFLIVIVSLLLVAFVIKKML